METSPGPHGGKKKETKLKCAEIERDIEELEARLLAENSDDLHHQLHLRQSDLLDLIEEKARSYAVVMQHLLFDVGDEASKLLAWLHTGQRLVLGLEIMDSEGRL
ncbi:hypothetical protein NDU88_002219 [Pleurodeles waltl]|uniref:Uncharacterized protein n=1 Tax=Pleurodeles waltl TaxID=8319 RepID=A0AAV7KUR4_PLEWA|nr:hypothetical protein NDU88_002219 [Pleurodeles waltl]